MKALLKNNCEVCGSTKNLKVANGSINTEPMNVFDLYMKKERLRQEGKILTKQNADKAIIVRNIKNPEWGDKRFV